MATKFKKLAKLNVDLSTIDGKRKNKTINNIGRKIQKLIERIIKGKRLTPEEEEHNRQIRTEILKLKGEIDLGGLIKFEESDEIIRNREDVIFEHNSGDWQGWRIKVREIEKLESKYDTRTDELDITTEVRSIVTECFNKHPDIVLEFILYKYKNNGDEILNSNGNHLKIIRYYTLKYFPKRILRKRIYRDTTTHGSDDQLKYTDGYEELRYINIIKLDGNGRRRKDGMFFKWFNMTSLDLSRYQLYNEKQLVATKAEYKWVNDEYKWVDSRWVYKPNKESKSENIEHCFIQALKLGYQNDKPIPPEIIDEIRESLTGLGVKTEDIKKISVKHNIYIRVNQSTGLGRNKHNLQYYNKAAKKSGYQVHMCYYKNHYFSDDENTGITTLDWKYYQKHQSKAEKSKGIAKVSSFRLIYELFQNKDFIKAIDFTNTELSFLTKNEGVGVDHVKEICEKSPEICGRCKVCLGTENEYKSAKRSFKKDRDIVIAFDCETDTSGEKHVPYAFAWKLMYKPEEFKIEEDFFTFGEFCDEDFKNNLINVANSNYILDEEGKRVPNKIICYAHNAGYDIRCAMWDMMWKASSICYKDGQFYSTSLIIHPYCVLEIRDSYRLIAEPLSKFPKMFKLKGVKEAYPYNYYTYKNFNRMVGKQVEGKKRKALGWNKLTIKQFNGIDATEKREKLLQFRENCKKLEIPKNDSSWMNTYCMYYNMKDCEILANGLMKFREYMMDPEIGQDIFDRLTISSIAHQWAVKKGCYKGVKLVSGVRRAFIQKTVVGGRVGTNEGKMFKIDYEQVDFDGISLYPSSMARPGCVPIGYSKAFKDIDTEKKYKKIPDFLKKKDGKKISAYFLKIKIHNVGKRRAFPLLVEKNEDGTLNWSNDVKEMYLNNIQLKDAIKFQKIEFSVIEGVYYDEGFNTVLQKEIVKLFDLRLTYKKIKNPTQLCVKLIMNSIYGKTIQKPSEETYSIVAKKDKYNFVKLNCQSIKSCMDLGNNFVYFTQHVNVDHSANLAHVGSLILGMSKRIMNEVMCLAEDNGIFIAYQDTDSMHMKSGDEFKLNKLFKKKYGRKLIGVELGQFHTDFSMKVNGIDVDDNIISIMSYFLAKKCYIDRLKHTDPVTGVETFDYHIRMKGINRTAIDVWCKQNKCKPMELYQHLFEGNHATFDLLAGGKVSFEKLGLGSIKSRAKLERTVQFKIPNADGVLEYTYTPKCVKRRLPKIRDINILASKGINVEIRDK